jgi:hypothetical protein
MFYLCVSIPQTHIECDSQVVWTHDASQSDMGSHCCSGDPEHPRLASLWSPTSISDVSVSAAGRHKIIALTNNYAAATDGLEASELEFLGWTDGASPPALRAMFDDYCDSSSLGMRYIYRPVYLTVHLLTSFLIAGSRSPSSIYSPVAGIIYVRRMRSFSTISDCKSRF